ncbi:hypothetical protein [Gordonia westfalica]|uniref:Uncharacterized protein n=1 Tax=Gordonia westfalica TaxID=158898 RepID=A0A1H2HB86_9ACTN|nr:hypothetical protein [Gordonia westfalica]SDU29105.1 hypothetical protein SAMN04488548_134370 [Gordonia westfalica]
MAQPEFARDLAHVPFRFSLLGRELVSADRVSLPSPEEMRVTRTPISPVVAEGLDLLLARLTAGLDDDRSALLSGIRGREVRGLLFSTRPFNMVELYLSIQDHTSPVGLAEATDIERILLAIRGYSPTGKLPSYSGAGDGNPEELRLDVNYPKGKRRVALAMLDTSFQSWKCAAIGQHDLGQARFEKLAAMFTELIDRTPGAHYALLPELALPSFWFVPIALKLQESGISLISGIEYQSVGTRKVANQVWAALRLDGLGYPAALVYKQDKQRPAPHEEHLLHDLASLTLEPRVRWDIPPIVAHGGFRFSSLICSELTNIGYRSALRGRVDAIFVPEWNQDFRTFEGSS